MRRLGCGNGSNWLRNRLRGISGLLRLNLWLGKRRSIWLSRLRISHGRLGSRNTITHNWLGLDRLLISPCYLLIWNIDRLLRRITLELRNKRQKWKIKVESQFNEYLQVHTLEQDIQVAWLGCILRLVATN